MTQIEIYADIVFLINLLMDAFIFWVTSKLIKQKVKTLRLFIGALVAASLYCLIVFVPELRIFYNTATSVLILLLSVIVTFRPRKVKELLKILAIAHIAAFSLGGLGMGLFYYTGIPSWIGNNIGFTIENLSFKVLLASACIAYIILKITIHWIKKIFIKKKTYYNIKICYDNGDLFVNTLMDTGNSLVEPISKMPVIIAEFDAVKDFLPDSLKTIFYEKKEDNLEFVVSKLQNEPIMQRLRMIPFMSIGEQNGMLIGFRPDSVEIFKEDSTVSIKNVIIGIYNFKLSADGSYQGLLNPEII